MVRRFFIATLAIASALACDGAVPLLGSNDEPTVLLVLSADPEGADSSLYAFVAGGTSGAQLRYGNLERFTMSRASDGAVVDWKIIQRSGTIVTAERDLTEWANVRLDWKGTGTRLGRSQLSRGERYDLSIVVDGREVTGSAVIPKGISLSTSGTGAGTKGTWTTSTPGTVFIVESSVDDPGYMVTSDTTYTVKGNLPRQLWSTPRIKVTAVDSTYLRFRVDTLGTTYGLSGARGVFVGVTKAIAPIDMNGAMPPWP